MLDMALQKGICGKKKKMDVTNDGFIYLIVSVYGRLYSIIISKHYFTTKMHITKWRWFCPLSTVASLSLRGAMAMPGFIFPVPSFPFSCVGGAIMKHSVL